MQECLNTSVHRVLQKQMPGANDDYYLPRYLVISHLLFSSAYAFRRNVLGAWAALAVNFAR
jgi:hypothetical protein